MVSKLVVVSILGLLFFSWARADIPSGINQDQKNELEIFVRAARSPKISQNLQKKIEQNPQEKIKVWIFFRDKGIFTLEQYYEALSKAEANLTERACKRRLKTMNQGALVDFSDLPVHQIYIEKVLNLDVKHRVTSRWLNAISVEATSQQLLQITELGFVSHIKAVVSFRRNEPGYNKTPYNLMRDSLDYGPSFNQLEQLNVPEVHRLGHSGSGVLICMLDTGFKRTHEALVDVTVVAEWDFINDDGNTGYEPGDPSGQPWHGTITLSTVGGFEEGHLIGPAYGADFVLAKTEDISQEQPIEEDWWVEGIEWADSLGADVVSSSLGYTDWYTYSDMNGDSCVTTIAADEAAAKGIIVCNAMGNEGQYPGSIIAPADADSIISCGAVDQSGNLAYFSSIGPTYDGRTKPEVVARGVNTYAADPDNDHAYLGVNGTSLSTPLIAGVAALILGAHPGWTNMEVREAMMMTASQAGNPDNYYGWGIPDALAALNYGFGIVVDWTEIPQENGTKWTINSKNNVTVDLGSTGGPHTWDFTSQPMGSDSCLVRIVPKSSTPFADSFPSANLVYKAVEDSNTSYQYQELDSNFCSTLGLGGVAPGTTYISQYEPVDSYPLPIIHGNSNRYHYGFEVEESGSVIKHEWYGRSVIDAWGTVEIPYGTYPCLRECRFDTCAITTFVSSNPVSGDTVTHIRYSFIAEEHNEVVCITSNPDETNPNYTDAAILERLTSLTGIEESKTITQNNLLSHYPNPFSGYVEIKFSLAKPSYLNLTIYDVSGRLVKTLINKPQQQGNYTVKWSGTNEAGNLLPNGVYFYYLNVDGTVSTGKMLLVR